MREEWAEQKSKAEEKAKREEKSEVEVEIEVEEKPNLEGKSKVEVVKPEDFVYDVMRGIEELNAMSKEEQEAACLKCFGVRELVAGGRPGWEVLWEEDENGDMTSILRRHEQERLAAQKGTPGND